MTIKLKGGKNMEIIDKKAMDTMSQNDELSVTNMLLLEIAIQLEKIVEQNGK